MSLFLLDAGGAGLFQYLILLGSLFMLLATLLECVVMILMKYNLPFKKAFGDSLLVNLTSLLMGFLLITLQIRIFDFDVWVNFLILYVLTVAVEIGILHLLNKTKPFTKSLTVCAVMNLVSYILLYVMTITSDLG